jgi:hypothetical protein
MNGQTRIFQMLFEIINMAAGHVVDNCDRVSVVKKPINQMAPDEANSTGYYRFHDLTDCWPLYYLFFTLSVSRLQ